MDRQDLQVGRVLRAGTRGFTIGCAVMQPDIPAFGAFVRVDGPAPDSIIYGLIYDVSTEDDLFVRQFISAAAPEEVVLDQRKNRQVPIEVSVLAVGCGDGQAIMQCLPAQPPVTLDWLYLCTDDEVRAFTARTDFFRLVLEAHEVPADELLAACLRVAAATRPEETRQRFLIDAGRELVRLLAAEPVRLEGLLRRLHR
jgi:hypothetical protein